MWGLLSDGLYGEADFNADGSLKNGLPVPTFGDVRPGDIKYLDQNGDQIIDQRDQRIIGHGIRTQYSLYLDRSEEQTSELQSLMRISYAVFCLTKKKTQLTKNKHIHKT